MARFIKIFTIMTGLSLMTACGASGVLDDVRDLLAEARAALTKEATESARNQFLDERIIDNMLAEEIANGLALEEQAEARLRITRQVAAFSDIKRESETAKVQDELDNLSPEELAEFNATVQKRLQFLGQVAGGTEETRTTYINECGVEGNTACIDVVSDACAVAAEVGSERCVSFTARVCDANPLYDACDDNDDYFLARDDVCWIQGRNGGTRTEECQQIFDTNRLQANAEPSCRANYISQTNENGFNTRCSNVVVTVCEENPFDVLCERNSTILNSRPARITACRDEVKDAPFCDHAKTFVCDKNPFDAICLITDYSTNTYATERNTAISECGQTFVAGERCEDAAEEFCGSATGEGLFNPLCLNDPETDAGRQPLCVGERVTVVTMGDNPITARCTGTATRICDADPLDPLCEDVTAYRARQFSACVVTPEDPSCAAGATQFTYITPIISCLSNPFGADCVNPATEAGTAFAPNLEAAQDSYCEGGATTKIATADRVNCTNIGSLPDYPALASGYDFIDGTFMFGGQTKNSKYALGGFLKTGVYGTGLGSYAGVQGSGGNPGTFTDENNNGNFDRGNPAGGAWVNLPSETAANLPAGHPTFYTIDPPRLFTPAPAGTTPSGGFVDRQRIYEFTSPVDSKDGFIFFITEIADEDNGVVPTSRSAYAGIFSTSNFGAPLAAPVDQAPTSAIWAGQFTAHSGNLRLNAEPTPFYVDFTNGTFNIHNPAGTDGDNPNGTAPKTGSVKAAVGNGSRPSDSNYYESSTFVYTVDGVFGAGIADLNNPGRMLNAGELSGKVRLVNTTYALEDQDSTYVEGVSVLIPTISIDVNMPLTGLIGVEGAVGVFLDPNPRNSAIVGGFTAAPMPTN